MNSTNKSYNLLLLATALLFTTNMLSATTEPYEPTTPQEKPSWFSSSWFGKKWAERKKRKRAEHLATRDEKVEATRQKLNTRTTKANTKKLIVAKEVYLELENQTMGFTEHLCNKLAKANLHTVEYLGDEGIKNYQQRIRNAAQHLITEIKSQYGTILNYYNEEEYQEQNRKNGLPRFPTPDEAEAQALRDHVTQQVALDRLREEEQQTRLSIEKKEEFKRSISNRRDYGIQTDSTATNTAPESMATRARYEQDRTPTRSSLPTEMSLNLQPFTQPAATTRSLEGFSQIPAIPRQLSARSEFSEQQSLNPSTSLVPQTVQPWVRPGFGRTITTGAKADKSRFILEEPASNFSSRASSPNGANTPPSPTPLSLFPQRSGSLTTETAEHRTMTPPRSASRITEELTKQVKGQSSLPAPLSPIRWVNDRLQQK